MPTNLLAICHTDSFVLKRVKITHHVQLLLEGMFAQQQEEFFRDISEEVLFDGGWKPDRDELLFVELANDALNLFLQSKENIIPLPVIDAKGFSSEGIKGLCVLMTKGGKQSLLIQNFSNRQTLTKKICLILDGDTFNEVTDPIFTLGTALAGVIEDEKLKFRSYNNIRMIFDLSNAYIAATDVEMDKFASHSNLDVVDVEKFKTNADQTVRKLVHAISKREVLDHYEVKEIVKAAALSDLIVPTLGGKISMPAEKKDVKAILHFLDDGLYKGALSGLRYITNSKRVF